MKHSLLTGMALVLTGVATAQTTTKVEVPGGGFNKIVDRNYDYMVIPGPNRLPLHHQANYAADDFISVKPAGSLMEIAWRRNNYYSNSMPAGTTTLTVKIGYAKTAPSAASQTFATNLGAPVSTFYQGTMNWPAATKGTGPAPYTHALKPKAPIPFLPSTVKGGSVVVDIVITASTYANSTYTIDAAGVQGGNRVTNGRVNSSCQFSNQKYNSGLSYTTGGLTNNGGTWYVQYNSLLPNAPGVSGWGLAGTNKPGTWPLPIDMTGLGAPGCHWDVEVLFWTACNANASGSARYPNFTIPPGFGGASFFDQGLWLDSAANAAGLVAGWSSEWQIGSGLAPDACVIYQLTDSGNSPTGSKRATFAPNMQFDY